MSKTPEVAAIILAAGKGERMKSSLPKVLHKICGRPMVMYVFDLIDSLKIKKNVLVLGYKSEEVRKIVPSGIKTVLQKTLSGTADAVKKAVPVLKGFKGTVIILYGDNPLLQKETLDKLIKHHQDTRAAVTLLTAKLKKPFGYGRIIRDKYSSVCGIVEEKDANDYQKDIKEINTGVMCFDAEKLFNSLRLVKPNNRKKEYYLTDCVEILYSRGEIVEGLEISDPQEAFGVNTRVELAQGYTIIQGRILEKYMKDGITIVDPRTTFINFGTEIGQDTVIYPFTVIENDVKIGSSCSVGPFCHLREGTRLSDEVKVGNFIEIVRSSLSPHTRAKHVGYIGDTVIGGNVNIGAGTITANYNGKDKNTTIIEDNAFIGSDTVLVAPVKIGKGARTGAGSVVTKNKNVPAGAVAVGVPARILK